MLTNAGATPTLNWSLANTASWMSASPSSGSLTPGGPATTVTVSLTAAATSLPFGNYSANIWFTNLYNGFVQSIPFNLAVDLVQNGGFESGDFTDWTFTNDPSATFVANDLFPNAFPPPHSGINDAIFGDQRLAYISQTIQTVPGKLYQISFWVNCDNLVPNEFLFNWDGQTLFDQAYIANFPTNAWTNLQFTAIATTNSTVIEFGAYDDNGYIGLDDVSVQPFVVPPLAFQSINRSGSSLQLTWNSSSGVVYQLQYNTNLGGTNWVNLGNPITATTSTVSTSTDITNGPEAFYRVQQLP